MRTVISKKVLYAAAAAFGLAASATMSQASLQINLVPTGGTAGDVVVNGNNVQVTKAGDVVTFNVVATVVGGGNGGTPQPDEGLQFAFGTATNSLTGAGSATGTFGAFSPLSAWNNTGQGGTAQPNGDRGAGTAGSAGGDYIEARSGNNTATNNPSPGAGQSFLAPDADSSGETVKWTLGTISWTVGAVPGTGTTQLNFTPRPPSGLFTAGASWLEDNTTKSNLASNGGAYNLGNAVAITAAPEPGSLALLGFGGLGLLLRRRRAM